MHEFDVRAGSRASGAPRLPGLLTVIDSIYHDIVSDERFCSAIERVASYAATLICRPGGRPHERIASSTTSIDR